MDPIYDPEQLSHPRLREFAVVAAWISTLAEAANDVEDLLIDVPPEERLLPDFSTPWPWDFDSFVVALSVVQHMRKASEQGLEELVATWLGEDRENWPVFDERAGRGDIPTSHEQEISSYSADS